MKERTWLACVITHDDDEPFHSRGGLLDVSPVPSRDDGEKKGSAYLLACFRTREVNKLGGLCVQGRLTPSSLPALLSYGGSGKFRIAPEQARQDRLEDRVSCRRSTRYGTE